MSAESELSHLLKRQTLINMELSRAVISLTAGLSNSMSAITDISLHIIKQSEDPKSVRDELLPSIKAAQADISESLKRIQIASDLIVGKDQNEAGDVDGIN